MEGNADAGRLALRPREAASKIGVSVDWLEDHVAPEIKTIRRGKLTLYPIVELERWVRESAEAVA